MRHRGTDIELLAESFRDPLRRRSSARTSSGFTRDALDILQRHDWPGNVRELEAAIQRAVAMCNGPRISSSHLAPILNHHRQTRGAAGTPRPHLPMGIRPLKEALEEPEKRIIIQALQAFNWNRQETARVLDINRTTLYKKMKKYGLLIDEPMWAQLSRSVSVQWTSGPASVSRTDRQRSPRRRRSVVSFELTTEPRDP